MRQKILILASPNLLNRQSYVNVLDSSEITYLSKGEIYYDYMEYAQGKEDVSLKLNVKGMNRVNIGVYIDVLQSLGIETKYKIKVQKVDSSCLCQQLYGKCRDQDLLKNQRVQICDCKEPFVGSTCTQVPKSLQNKKFVKSMSQPGEWIYFYYKFSKKYNYELTVAEHKNLAGISFFYKGESKGTLPNFMQNYSHLSNKTHYFHISSDLLQQQNKGQDYTEIIIGYYEQKQTDQQIGEQVQIKVEKKDGDSDKEEKLLKQNTLILIFVVITFVIILLICFITKRYVNQISEQSQQEAIRQQQNRNENQQATQEKFDKECLKKYLPLWEFGEYEDYQYGNQENFKNEKEQECTVCLVNFELDSKIRTSICKHIFHVECIETWLEKHSNCPLCRQSFLKKDMDEYIEKHNINLSDLQPSQKKIKKFNISNLGEQDTNASDNNIKITTFADTEKHLVTSHGDEESEDRTRVRKHRIQKLNHQIQIYDLSPSNSLSTKSRSMVAGGQFSSKRRKYQIEFNNGSIDNQHSPINLQQYFPNSNSHRQLLSQQEQQYLHTDRINEENLVEENQSMNNGNNNEQNRNKNNKSLCHQANQAEQQDIFLKLSENHIRSHSEVPHIDLLQTYNEQDIPSFRKRHSLSPNKQNRAQQILNNTQQEQQQQQ